MMDRRALLTGLAALLGSTALVPVGLPSAVRDASFPRLAMVPADVVAECGELFTRSNALLAAIDTAFNCGTVPSGADFALAQLRTPGRPRWSSPPSLSHSPS